MKCNNKKRAETPPLPPHPTHTHIKKTISCVGRRKGNHRSEREQRIKVCSRKVRDAKTQIWGVSTGNKQVGSEVNKKHEDDKGKCIATSPLSKGEGANKVSLAAELVVMASEQEEWQSTGCKHSYWCWISQQALVERGWGISIPEVCSQSDTNWPVNMYPRVKQLKLWWFSQRSHGVKAKTQSRLVKMSCSTAKRNGTLETARPQI